MISCKLLQCVHLEITDTVSEKTYHRRNHKAGEHRSFTMERNI